MPAQLTRRAPDIMAVIWTLGSATVAEVKAGLTVDLAYPTVLTMLRTLERKLKDPWQASTASHCAGSPTTREQLIA